MTDNRSTHDPATRMAAVLLAGLAVVWCAGTARADVLMLRDGSMVVGDVIEVTEDAVTILVTQGEDAPAKVTYKSSLVKPRSFVAIRGESLGDHEVDGLLALCRPGQSVIDLAGVNELAGINGIDYQGIVW